MNLEFKKQPKKKTTKPTNLFVVSLTAMHGDADHYDTFETNIPKDKEDVLKRLILDCEATMEVYYGGDEMSNSPFYRNWTEGGYDYDEENEDNDSNNYGIEWTGDVTCDHQWPASLNGISIVFLDENGDKVDVIYTLTAEDREQLPIIRQNMKDKIEAKAKKKRANKTSTSCLVCGYRYSDWDKVGQKCKRCEGSLLETIKLFDENGDAVKDKPEYSLDFIKNELIPAKEAYHKVAPDFSTGYHLNIQIRHWKNYVAEKEAATLDTEAKTE